VPSSTSSSDLVDLELPRRSLLSVGVSSLAGAAALLAGIEIGARRRGFEPELRDSAELWCSARDRARALGRRALALVGSSRFQLGIDPAELAPLPHELVPVQLAINGSPALPVLGELAADDSFRGTILCEVMPQNFFTASALRGDGVPWLSYARSQPAAGPVEGQLRTVVQQRVACIQPALDLRVVARRLLLRQGLPPPPYFRLRPDRFIEADYAKADTRALLKQWIARAKARATPPSELALASLLETTRTWCRAITARGGRVVFVRMISSLRVREFEDTAFPRDLYWERLLRETGAAGVYDSDIPGTESLVCPEGSHLDAAQARVFTRRLAAVLTSQRLV
jgi:hypothetical protein